MMATTLVWRQTWALVKKNWTIAVVRSWISTILRALVIPIVLLVLLLEIQDFSKSPNVYGVGTPAPIPSLADSMKGSDRLAIIRGPRLGPDVSGVIDTIVRPLSADRVQYLDNEDDVRTACNINYRGNSDCHAVIIFNDSPLSGRVNATWNYTIKAGPDKSGGAFNVFNHDNVVENFWLPLETTIDNAITNTSIVPEAVQYAWGDEELFRRNEQKSFRKMVLSLISFVLFITMVPASHHISSMIASERESGLTRLLDAMSGGIAVPRILAYALALNVIYFPLWIIMGVLYWYLLFSRWSVAVTIFWQIFTGMAVLSSSIFGASFFRSSSLAATIVPGLTLIMAVITVWQENTPVQQPASQVIGLGLFFPGANYVMFLSFLLKWEILEMPTMGTLTSTIPKERLEEFVSSLCKPTQVSLGNWTTTLPPRIPDCGTDSAQYMGPYIFWVLLALQIIGYLLLAIIVDRYFQGNEQRKRSFNTGAEAEASSVAIETVTLQKHYVSFWKKLFGKGKSSTVKAVNGLDLVSQKRQILCLLGPNGSGKTTTLEMIAGFQAPTLGSISINSASSQLGICPQKNILWDNLTVIQHLTLWNAIKGGSDDAAAIEKLIERCDLVLKKSTLSKYLSGGTKRKLQLACMLVGGSSICLLDEVTSGLDPVSRRVLWNAILAERSHRTMVLTTHFLDECEVLSDHIVILSHGKVKCQGTPSQLKNEFGGGYRVHIPKTKQASVLDYPSTEHGDQLVVRVPDSTSAVNLFDQQKTSRSDKVYITGPTIEDVFLRVSAEPDVSASEGGNVTSDQLQTKPIEENEAPIALSQRAIFFRQFSALYWKRLLILRSQWPFYLFAIIIPIVVTVLIKDFLRLYEPPTCTGRLKEPDSVFLSSLYSFNTIVAGPVSANATLNRARANTIVYGGPDAGISPVLRDTKEDLMQYLRDFTRNVTAGGVFVDNTTAPLIAIPVSYIQYSSTSALWNVAHGMRTGAKIFTYTGYIRSLSSYSNGSAALWVIIFCLIQGLYPAMFTLYPTYEKRSKVRSLQYSNGIQTAPLWLAYLMFDLMFVTVISVICTVLIRSQAPFWGLGYIFLVIFFYGIAATLLAYIISTFSSSQPAAIAWSILIMAIMYAISVISTTLVGDSVMALDGIAFGLGLIFPIQNVFRALSVSLNLSIVRCRGNVAINYEGSIYAFGGPILLLIIQCFALFAILMWIEGTIFSSSKLKVLQHDYEKVGHASGRPEVDEETARVEASQTDLLRVLHVSKQFGPNVAVENISLGLRKGEILALLGPNGAGKTTTINMIRGEVLPTSGKILLDDVDVQKNKTLAQRQLGVCPQFDALDMLTAREQLAFYAQSKGIADVPGEVAFVMSKVGITAKADHLAAKLSGGNKRKLSLAIALLGNPPVLLLDEPSSAMDATSKRLLWNTLRSVAAGRSILITTHSMEEADALATRAAIISRRLLAIGGTQELREAYSNELIIHLVLKTAPSSSVDEMGRVANWVRRKFPTAQFEGDNLGGQVRFVVLADSAVPGAADQKVADPNPSHSDSEITETNSAPPPRSYIKYMVQSLERDKDDLGLECYSIGAATMERVFLSVVKEGDVQEEPDEKRPWWKLRSN